MPDDNEILKQHRERESNRANESLQKSPEDLLKEIFSCSTDHFSQGSPTSISKTIAYFSSLLIILSRQAEESTNKIVKLTNTLTYLTWAIAVFTAISLIVIILQFME